MERGVRDSRKSSRVPRLLIPRMPQPKDNVVLRLFLPLPDHEFCGRQREWRAPALKTCVCSCATVSSGAVLRREHAHGDEKGAPLDRAKWGEMLVMNSSSISRACAFPSTDEERIEITLVARLGLEQKRRRTHPRTRREPSRACTCPDAP